MPASMLLVNPSKPRRFARRGGSASPAQLAARAKFAARARAGTLGKARKNPSSKRSFASTPFGKRILASKNRKNPRLTASEKRSAESLAADRGWPVAIKTGVVTQKRKSAVKSKKKVARKAAPKTAKKKLSQTPSAKAARRARRASKKGAKSVVRRVAKRRGKRVSPVVVGLRAASKRLRNRARKAKGASKSILSLRSRALNLKARAKSKSRKSKKTGKYVGLSPAQRKQLKASGLMKVNPSIMGVIMDMGVLLPQVGATIGAIAGVSMLSQLILGQVRKSAPTATWAANKHTPAAISVLLSVAAYGIARMVGSQPGAASTFVNKLAPSLLIGGMAAAAVQTMGAVRVAPGAGQTAGTDGKISLGNKLGLPIGEYVLGEYVLGGGPSFIDIDGTSVGIDVGSVFRDRTLGQYVPYEVRADGAREGGRGRHLETSAASIVREELDAYDGKLPVEGNLSGSIFDD